MESKPRLIVFTQNGSAFLKNAPANKMATLVLLNEQPQLNYCFGIKFAYLNSTCRG
tara:strand:+ start:417 stop:584 length:168 start_codon:yes stop_codon:yes gene_type:complete